MKSKFLIPIFLAFMFIVMTLFFNNGSNENQSSNLFIESDNIAYAEDGYTCAPKALSFCDFPGGNDITPFVRR